MNKDQENTNNAPELQTGKIWHEFKEYVLKAKALPGQSNENLLMLYGLFMQSTEGDIEGSKPGIFDMGERSKYNAWAFLKGKQKEIAMQGYINLVKHLLGEE